MPIPPANLSCTTLNGLVKLANNEATHLCRDILSIPVPALDTSKPLVLHLLGAPPSQPKQKKGPVSEVESDSDEAPSDGEHSHSGTDDDEIGSTDDKRMDVDPAKSKTLDVNINEVVRKAALHSARYSAHCTDLEMIFIEAEMSDVDHAIPIHGTIPILFLSTTAPINETDSPILSISKIIDEGTGKISI
ncbi:hypothetical protein BDN72DRAFT_897453 [Pluteus cervinus]|uniref:Uncharacterized protein n=1 Tax=Pluteus cervinus TaxID=181527 RepID=A0ACD3AV71_9AGAR|nr:hypothetical protein BDN72DRAFT_897453 [Pluteus cervinus]